MLSLLSAAVLAGTTCRTDGECADGEYCRGIPPPRIARACVERDVFAVDEPCTDELAHCCPEGTTCEVGLFARWKRCKRVEGECAPKTEACCMAFPGCKLGFERDDKGVCTEADFASGRCVKEAMCCKEITCVKTDKKTCDLACGTEVPHGWSGKDEGWNHCNRCRCNDGVLGCTRMGCDKRECPVPEKKPCTLSCGTEVPHGWSGKGEGGNWCNNCRCFNGILGCTKMGCGNAKCPTPAPVEEKPCTLSCGTVVPHGWSGKGEGENHCNRCSCTNGAVACTRKACSLEGGLRKYCPCNEFTEPLMCIALEGVCYNPSVCSCGFFDQVKCLVEPCSVNSCPKGYKCQNSYCGGCHHQCVKEE